MDENLYNDPNLNTGETDPFDFTSILKEFDAQIEADMKDFCTEEVIDPRDNVEKSVNEFDDPDYKSWLFEENVRLREVERRLDDENSRLDAYAEELEKKARDIEERSEKFIRDRAQFREEMANLSAQINRDRQRLKQEEQFFNQKMEILKAGFADLDKAKREFEAQKMRYESQNTYYVDDDMPGYSNPTVRSLYSGITNPLMLKKRYKDLVKIFHPDNMAGDHELFKAITLEYERLQGRLGTEEGIG